MNHQPDPIRIRRSRAKGWKMPPNTICVTRPGKFGNPWTVAKAREIGFTGTDGELSAMCAQMFDNAMRKCLPAVAEIIAALPELRGRNLACWCALDKPCHADVLLRMANAPRKCEAMHP